MIASLTCTGLWNVAARAGNRRDQTLFPSHVSSLPHAHNRANTALLASVRKLPPAVDRLAVQVRDTKAAVGLRSYEHAPRAYRSCLGSIVGAPLRCLAQQSETGTGIVTSIPLAYNDGCSLLPVKPLCVLALGAGNTIEIRPLLPP